MTINHDVAGRFELWFESVNWIKVLLSNEILIRKNRSDNENEHSEQRIQKPSNREYFEFKTFPKTGRCGYPNVVFWSKFFAKLR